MLADFLLTHEALVRGTAFAGILALVGLAETLAPRRPWRTGRGFRWLNNLAVVVVDTILLRLLFPVLEVGLNLTSMFNHGNFRMPLGLDRALRLIVVTPDMHRVHHSIWRHETNSNFGFNLPWWDRCLGTYRDQPQDGHAAMTIGLSQFQ